MSILGGGSTKTPHMPKPAPPEPKETAPAAEMAAADERRRILLSSGRRKTILSYGQLTQANILKSKLGE